MKWYGTGNNPTAWATGATGNWKDEGGATANFSNGNQVIFDDTAQTVIIDILTEDVTPASVTFNADTKDYLVRGDYHRKGIVGPTEVIKNGAGKVTMTSTNRYTGVTYVNAGTLVLANNAQSPVLLGAGVRIAQGAKLLFDYYGSPSPAGHVPGVPILGPIPIPMLLAEGYASNFATWQFRIVGPSDTRVLGWRDNWDCSLSTPGPATNLLSVRATVYGDLNLDGVVSAAELNAIMSNAAMNGGVGTSGVWKDGVMNYDGLINSTDYAIAVAGSRAGYGAAIPEPGTLTLLGMGVVGMLAYAWRKRG